MTSRPITLKDGYKIDKKGKLVKTARRKASVSQRIKERKNPKKKYRRAM